MHLSRVHVGETLPEFGSRSGIRLLEMRLHLAQGCAHRWGDDWDHHKVIGAPLLLGPLHIHLHASKLAMRRDDDSRVKASQILRRDYVRLTRGHHTVPSSLPSRAIIVLCLPSSAMLSNSAWATVDDIQAEVERRVTDNKPSKSQPAKNLPFPRYLHVADTAYSHVRFKHPCIWFHLHELLSPFDSANSTLGYREPEEEWYPLRLLRSFSLL